MRAAPSTPMRRVISPSWWLGCADASRAVQGVRSPRVAGRSRRSTTRPRPGQVVLDVEACAGQLPRRPDHPGQVPVQAAAAVLAGSRGRRGRQRRRRRCRRAGRRRPGVRVGRLGRPRREGRRRRLGLPARARRHGRCARVGVPLRLRHVALRAEGPRPAAAGRDAARPRRRRRRRSRRRRARRGRRAPR